MRLGDKGQQIMANEEYVGYLENIRDMFIVGCEHCEGDALKYQQHFISALNFAITYIKSNLEGKEETKMKDKIKQAVADEFKYRASQGRTNYSMEEVIQIVGEVIDEVAFENK